MTIKNMKKTGLLILIIVGLSILSTNVSYAKKAEAYLYMYVINDPPKITGMSIYGFAETGLRCNSSVEDEYTEKVKLHYYWYKDDELISTDESLDKNLIKKGERITCKVVPDDNAQLGEPGNVSSIVLGEPVGMKMNRVTGSVIGSIGSNKGMSLIGLLLFLSAALLIFDLVILRMDIFRKGVSIK